MTLLAACVAAPRGTLDASCSGVPGDGRTPATIVAAVAARDVLSDGPERHLARARPATGDIIPALYVFDDAAAPVFAETLRESGFDDPVFEHAEQEAYWAEVEGGSLARVPWLDKCSAASMLDHPIDFRAPVGGVLFLQFVAKGCRECEAISRAIVRQSAASPGIPVRWLQIEVPRSVGWPVP